MNYFATRTLAQSAAKESADLRFVDNGSDAAKGERWAVKDITAKVVYKNKMEHAVVIVGDMSGERRKDVIARLMAEAELTKNGASTYYYKIKGKTEAA